MGRADEKPVVIAASSAGQARAWATRRGIRNWAWMRNRRDVVQHMGSDVVLLPGWEAHWIAPDIEWLFTTSLAPSRSSLVN